MGKKFRGIVNAFFVSSNKNGKEGNTRKFPKVKTGKFVDGHQIGYIYKEKDVPICFSCQTCRGAITHPYNEESGHFDVRIKNPLPH